YGSGHTKVTAAVAERYGIPIIACASSEAVHDQGFKNLFGTLAPSSGLTDAMLTKFKATKPDVASIAILGREDVFPKLMADLMKTAAEKSGLKVVYSGYYPIGTVDHSAALTAMRQVKPDWVFITGYSQDLILARKQMADLGLKAPIVTMITELDTMTFFGPVKFREDGMNSSRALPLIQIQEGKPVLIYPNELSTTAMRLN